jgi:hypothetical protein
MKSLFLFLAISHLSAATVTIPLATITASGGDTPNSCPSQEVLETFTKSIRNSTIATLSLTGEIPQCGDGIWYQVVAINMSSADSQCPGAWVEENEGGVRACGRGSVGPNCQSVLLNTEQVLKYSHTWEITGTVSLGLQMVHS